MMSSIVRPAISSSIGTVRVLGMAAVLAVCAMALPAFAQDADLKSLLDRIQRLERDIRTLNVEVARGGSVPAGQTSTSAVPSADLDSGARQTVARMEVRLTSLEEEARAATGQAEKVSHQLDQINQRLDKLVGDIDYRLSALEKSQAELRAQIQGGAAPTENQAKASAGPSTSAVQAQPPVQVDRPGGTMPSGSAKPGVLGTLSGQDLAKFDQRQATGTAAKPQAAPAATPQQTASPQAVPQQAAAPAAVLPEGTPKEQYAYAFGLLRQARYDDAETALTTFLKEHGDDPLASNARYWLGETFYVRGDYVKAAEIFLDGYQKDPKGAKAADKLLKLGMSLSNLDKKREACAAFGKLTKEFPNVPSTIERVLVKERQKNACN